MEIDTSKFDIGKNAVLVENNAQTIFDHLNELEKDSKDYSKRWFWELLQNAKDSVTNNSKVSVKVNLLKNNLSFHHSGEAFEQTDILHLIFHGSSKKSLEGKTGRFGTGFMATHLLSRKVNITGKLADETYFKFDLNREALDVAEQQRNLEDSYTLFCRSNKVDNYSDNNYNTIFSYDLSEPSLKIANEGISQLQKILPFVLAFNEKIQDIEVVDNGKIVSIKRGTRNVLVYDKYNIIHQEIIFQEDTFYVVFVKNIDSDVAVLLEKKSDIISIVDLNDYYPKLFYDFPLFGTEKFGCPVIINSTKFDLKGERDGIYLGVDDKEIPTIIENKKIISDSIKYISVLIKFLTENKVHRIYNLFKLNSPFEYTWLNKDWLESLYIKMISVLLETECLKLAAEPLKLNNLVIPFSKTIETSIFFKLVTDFIHDYTPQYTEVAEWTIVTEGYSRLEKKELISYDFIVDERKLCKLVESKTTLFELNNIFIKGDKCESQDFSYAVSWLNDLFKLLSKEQTELLTSQYNIIPNQNKQLIRKELNKPYIDNIGDEKLKIVAENFGWDIKSELVYPGIIIKEGIFQKITLEETITTINNLSNKVIDEQLIDDKLRKAFISNLKWLVDNKKKLLIKDVFVVVEKGRDSVEMSFSKRRLFQSNADKLIAPSSNWNEKYSIYKEIVLKKFILIDEYSNYLTKDDFKFLQTEDLIFIGPLVSKKNPSKNDLKLLVKNIESYNKLLNDKDEVIDNNIEYSDIAYLTRSDDNILAKTGDSIKSAKSLLKFLLSQVLENDQFFNQTQELNIGGELITINKCLWVARLRDTQWIPVKTTDGEKQSNSERPSVANITELIRDDVEIPSIIKTKNAALFFNQLGISVADIIRNTLSSEEEKLKWDMTFSQLLMNESIDPDLALEMLGDPRLQEVYLKQKKEREHIKANQKIGYLFESIFNSIFDSDEYKDQGFSIERTAIGSDYGVIYEHDFVDENGKEIYFAIDQVLIELKATGKSYAEMTPTQAEEATTYIGNYVLAVLPLNNYELTKISVKENARFAVKIAEPLRNRYLEFQSYSDKKRDTTQEKADVRLNIEDGNIRYQVKSELWINDSLNFDEFISWLKTRKNK